MKDEEMADKHAEEYVMREDIITEDDRVPFDNGYGFQTVSFEDDVKKGYKDGFLAGLKAGRPQWHDLRKAPNDLPKDNDEKLCFYGKGKVVARYDSEYGCWDTYFNNLETVIPSSVIIAWCELPTFDKE